MILVSAGLYLCLHRIPELRPVCDGSTDGPVVSMPLATHFSGASVNDNPIWNMLCPHFDGRLATYTFSEEDALLILPPPGESQDKCVRYVVDGPCSMGYSRAIGCMNFIDQQPMELECFTHYTRSDRHVGYRRLGRTEAPHPLQTVTIPLLGQDGRVEDLSWDEESGRISVIFSPLGDRGVREMLLLYMIS
jgi:hypothetical protein